jgi:hypothetical protein
MWVYSEVCGLPGDAKWHGQARTFCRVQAEAGEKARGYDEGGQCGEFMNEALETEERSREAKTANLREAKTANLDRYEKFEGTSEISGPPLVAQDPATSSSLGSFSRRVDGEKRPFEGAEEEVRRRKKIEPKGEKARARRF